MARPATGQVVKTTRKDGTIVHGLRYRSGGARRYVTLGIEGGDWRGYDGDTGWTDQRAEEARGLLCNGAWIPPEPEPEAVSVPAPEQTFHEFASAWWALRKPQKAKKTQEDYDWRLTMHLLPAFGRYRLSQIDYDMVERYVAKKLAEGKLSPRSINMTMTLAAAIYDSAIERRDDLWRNPFKGNEDNGRRVKQPKPSRYYLRSADQIQALLDAAGKMDVEAREQHVQRRAIIATLILSGLRISELCDLRWRSVDLPGGWLNVEGSKTDAAERQVQIRGALRDVLLQIKPVDTDPNAYVFPTSKGKRMNPSNTRNRILTPAVEKASASLVKRGLNPLSRLTPHGCRRTFASILYALGEPSTVVMAEMGHEDSALALNMYAKVMRRSDDENAQLRALVEGTSMGNTGNKDQLTADDVLSHAPAEGQETSD